MKTYTLNDLKIHDIGESDSLGYALHIPVSGIDMPAIRLGSEDRPSQYGANVPAQLYGGRTVNLSGIVWGGSISDHYGRRRDLETAVAISKSNYNSIPFLNKFTTDDNIDLQFLAFLQAFSMPDLYLNHSDFTATLFAKDPRLYGQTAHSQDIEIGSDVITNAGNMTTPPVLTFVGPLTTPIFTLDDLGQAFKLNVAIAGGHDVIVDIFANTILFDGVTNYNQYFDDANFWIELLPGDNNVTLATGSGGDTGHVTVDFRDAYVGS